MAIFGASFRVHRETMDYQRPTETRNRRVGERCPPTPKGLGGLGLGWGHHQEQSAERAEDEEGRGRGVRRLRRLPYKRREESNAKAEALPKVPMAPTANGILRARAQ